MTEPLELLSPAGSPEALRSAILYGADAVYLGGPALGLRAKAKNFTREELAESVRYAHGHGVKVYVTLNILAHDEQLEGLEDYLLFLRDAGADALIMADPGMIMLAREKVPELPVHLSTQAGTTNYLSYRFWAKQGVSRVVAARELSLEELREIRANTPETLELEAFVHGAMCVSVSGRCLLSNYLTGQESNLGACTHPCRWRYAVCEETRPGEYFPITEEEGHSFIFNSRDLCMVGHLPELIASGVRSFKIEGRMKTPFYVAAVTKIYREALDDLSRDPALYESKKASYLERLSLVSHRGYETGFYLGRPGPESMAYEDAAYEKNADFMGKALDEEARPAGLPRGAQRFEQRGKFSVGDTVTVLMPSGEDRDLPVKALWNAEGAELSSVPHAQEIFYLETGALPPGTVLYKKR